MAWRDIPGRIARSGLVTWVAVGAALALGVRPAVLALTHRAALPQNDISQLEGQFEAIGRAIPRTARIGWLLPRDPPGLVGTFMVVSQYALLPRRLANVDVRDCARRGRDACGAGAVDFLIVPAWRTYSAVEDAARLGFRIDRAEGAALLLAERVR